MGKIHVCVGFYPNGTYVINHVRDEDLGANVDYNRRYRPGRAYFVDGEHACGGLPSEPGLRTRFVETCKRRIANMALPEPLTDSRPYA